MFIKKLTVWQVILNMDPLEEIFSPVEITTMPEEEQRKFEMSLIPDFWKEREMNYKLALSSHYAKKIYVWAN